MLLWLIVAALTALSAYVVARPFLAPHADPVTSGSAAIYRDQLAELSREADRGEIAASEAEEARREIARRLLAADAAERTVVARGIKGEAWLGLTLTAIIPLSALILYVMLGQPHLAGQPLADRDMAQAMQSAPLEEVAESLFQRLAMDPNHPEGWVLLARTYMRLGRYDEAAAAYQEAVNRLGAQATADLYSAWGEAQALASGGRVTAEAAAAFGEALKRNPKDAPARYYLAIAKAQGGDVAGAVADLEALLADTPVDAPQHPMIIAKINELEGNGAPKDDPAIRGMVDNLAAKLEAEPANLEGWLLLLTSYMRLEEPDKAREALARARAIFKDDPAALEAIAARARELGLEPED